MKEFIEWSDTLSIGVKEIDDQHRTLVDMLNKLNEAIHGGWGKEARREVIDTLIEYTRVHFATEESLMSISNYPNSKGHKKQHAEQAARYRCCEAQQTYIEISRLRDKVIRQISFWPFYT
jgi:hemerythrin